MDVWCFAGNAVVFKSLTPSRIQENVGSLGILMWTKNPGHDHFTKKGGKLVGRSLILKHPPASRVSLKLQHPWRFGHSKAIQIQVCHLGIIGNDAGSLGIYEELGLTPSNKNSLCNENHFFGEVDSSQKGVKLWNYFDNCAKRHLPTKVEDKV